MNPLETEIAARKAIGCELLSVKAMGARFRALGYGLDRSMDCRALSHYLTGEHAGRSYPACTTGVRETDSGRSAFHYQSRRDAKFRAMHELRNQVFAVSRGAILEA